MSTADLRAALASAPAGAEVHIEVGEHRGPWVIDRPLRLVGSGGASVLWAPSGPTLLVRSGGVHLQQFSLEVTQEDDGVALAVAGHVLPPTVDGVRVMGRVEGLGDCGDWRLPKSVDFGAIESGARARRVVSLNLPGAVEVRSELDGLHLHTERARQGGVVLQMDLDAEGMAPGVILDGRLEVQACGLSTWVRVTAQVTEAAAPSRRAARNTIMQALDEAWVRHAPPGSNDPAGVPPAPASPPGRTGTSTLKAEVAALLARVEAVIEAGDGELAGSLLAQALRLAPAHPQVHGARARMLERQGRCSEAAKAWRRVLELEPMFPGAHLRMAGCLSQLGQFEQALGLLESARHQQGHAQDAEFLKVLAQTCFHAGRPGEAVKVLAEAEAALGRPDSRLDALRAAWSRAESER